MISAGKRNLLVQWCCMYLSPLAVLYTNRIHILFLLFVLQKELEKYKKDNGHCRMPARHQCETGTFLGPWVMQQRYLYKKYKNNEPAYGMTPMRINHLENIGFEWSIPLK